MTDFDQFDEANYPRPNDNDFSQIIDRAVSRRQFLAGSTAFGVSAFISSAGFSQSALANASATAASGVPSALNFDGIKINTQDTITLPKGYRYEVLIRWGDPILEGGSAFDHQTRGSAESQAKAFGDNNDGMAFFPLDDNHAVMAVNNEYINRGAFYAGEPIDSTEKVIKGQEAHGVSVFTVVKKGAKWQLDPQGKHNRKITARSEMQITGPAAGHELLKTSNDPSGTRSYGTWNNCGNGKTPWGTYLTCEENFNGYFGSTNDQVAISAEQTRYGIGPNGSGYNWHAFDERFDIDKEPNEANRSGYVVEIDPLDPTSTPKKRTALGRFKHENAELVIADNGKVVVYLGDDERGEHLYRFISDGVYTPDNAASNRDLLENGTLYVAKFGEAQGDKIAGKGEWIELTHGKNGLTPDNGFESQAQIAILTRFAASQVGATTMDRPEWVAANPHKAEVYCSLTNNKNRGKKPNAGGVETPVGGPNPREGNLYGQIVRWQPAGGDHTAAEFAWDLFVLAGNPEVHAKGLERGSSNVTKDNMFNSPDGLAFDPDGRLWIQTDGNYSNEGEFAGMGNNQMLVGDPASGEIRRFMTGPVACEITGVCWSPDKTAMFVGIQHPGGSKGKGSNFPEGNDATPRSSVVVISREDGGVIGA